MTKQSTSLSADQGQWESLEDTYWYVPTPYLPAVVLVNTDPTRFETVVDQTVWHITKVFDGYVIGEVATSFGGGWIYSTLVGSITPSGAVSFSFTPEDPDSDITVGIGSMVAHAGEWFFEMQMTTGSGSASVTHWAYMAETDPDERSWYSLPGYPGTGIEDLFDDDTSNDAGGEHPLELIYGTDRDDVLSVSGRNPGLLLFGEGGDDTLRGSGKIDGLVGGAGDDRMFGAGGADELFGQSGADTLKGGRGDDWLDGGPGRDRLSGGEGADRFVFADASDTRASAPDVITDFDRAEHDLIDLSPLDAGPNLLRDNAVEFLGTKVFSGQAGQVRFEVLDGKTVVYGDMDGDAVADFAIRLIGEHNLRATDFLL